MDRNSEINTRGSIKMVALRRRAWIEISYGALAGASEIVALRKESVDRNFDTVQIVIIVMRRSPQGERG